MSEQSKEPDEIICARIRQNWFMSVYDTSDLALQRRMWLDPTHGNPYWSYSEFVCSYPDHGELVDGLSRGWLTTAEFTILSELEQTILNYSAPGDNTPAAALDDPEWRAVETALERAAHEPISKLTSESELVRALLKYRSSGTKCDDATILDDPAWQAVVTTAQRARQELLSLVTSPIEREILLGSRRDFDEVAS